MSEARLRVQVHPGARRNEILGFQGEVLRLRVTAPPERGRANEAVIELLAGALGVPKSRLSLVKGVRSREKVVAVQGLDAADAKKRLIGGAD